MSTSKAGTELFRQQPPPPGPEPVVEIGEYATFKLRNGLQVIVVSNDKLPRVSYQLLVDMPPVEHGDYAGLGDLTGEMLSKGTSNRTKQELDEAIDFIGATLSTSSNGIYGSSLKKHTETLLELMSDVLMNPIFPEDEFQKLKLRVTSGITASQDDPNAIAQNVAKVLRYGKDHPYGEITTIESVEKIELQRCVLHYKAHFVPAISYLAIVGDISVDEAKVLVDKYFSEWKSKPYAVKRPRLPRFPSAVSMNFVDKPEAVQSVVTVTYPIEFNHNAPDRMAATLMNTLLGGFFSSRINLNVREDKGYTYGANSSLVPDQYIGSFSMGGSFGTAVTDSAITELLNEMERLKTELISDEELELLKNYSAGTFARSLERPQTIANFALNIARYALPKDYYETYLTRLNAVTKEEIRFAAQKYLRSDRASILVVGNSKELKSKLAQFDHNKQIQHYDINGNPIEVKMEELPEGLTVEDVLKSYIHAIGGEENIKAIHTIEELSSGNLGGTTLTNETLYKIPGRMKQVMKASGQILQGSLVNGDKAQLTRMGNTETLHGKDADVVIEQANPFPELDWLSDPSNIKLKDIQIVDGVPCYKLEMATNEPAPRLYFYETETHLKRRVVISVAMGDQITTQNIDYQNYGIVEGVYFPFTVQFGGQAMPMPLVLNVESRKVNIPIEDSEFEIQ